MPPVLLPRLASAGLLLAAPAAAFAPKKSSLHCVQWSTSIANATPFDVERSGVIAPEPDSPQICRPRGGLVGETDLLWKRTSVGSVSAHARVGALVGDRCLPLALAGRPAGVEGCAAAASDGAAACTQIEYAGVHPDCSVWWREVAADVIPPIPELLLVFGTDADGRKLGLCRSFGDRQTRHADAGERLLGTMPVEGPDFGRCLFHLPSGGTGSLEGGLFHVLQGRARGVCEDEPALQAELARGFVARVERFLGTDDRELIQRVVRDSGTAAADFNLEELLSAVRRLGSCELRDVFSVARFVPSALNRLGLHLLRCLLAERMDDARVGYYDHPDFIAWRRDGVLLKDLDDPALGGDVGVLRLLRMISGEEVEGLPELPLQWTMRNVTVQPEQDQQTSMHVDTFATIFKVWVFPGGPDPPAVRLEQGPLMYVKGSHRNSEGKLRWMHVYAQPPAAEALREPSFRLHGCEAAEQAAGDFVRWAEATEMPVLPLPGVQRTLVIADTSGLHRRGYGEAGRTRHSWRLAGDNDGGLRRLDPFRWSTGLTS